LLKNHERERSVAQIHDRSCDTAKEEQPEDAWNAQRRKAGTDMENMLQEPDANSTPQAEAQSSLLGIVADFRPDLAFPTLTEEMLQRLRPYGQSEAIPANTTLYTYGDRLIDLFVILEGGIDVCLPATNGNTAVFARHRKHNFTGEFNLLNTQRSLVEAHTAMDSCLQRISRADLQRLMRAEGDIANLIVQAAIWRRIGILKEASGGVALVGSSDDAEVTLLRRFFVRNNYPFQHVEAPTEENPSAGDPAPEAPAVILSDGRILHRPTIPELADELGITELPDSELVYDVAVVGAGPAGLAAAVYAASEGLCTIVIEGLAPGGQAGTSSKIENYLGFPTGVSGQQLASRAQLQALKFGVHFAIARETISAEQVDGIHRLTLAGGIPVHARSVVIASGAQYRRLSVRNDTQFENRGLYYAATAMESIPCRDREVIVVGGGNSAGQASVFLSGIANHVHHIVRGGSLQRTMSQYLVSRIEGSSKISLYTHSEIEELEGNPGLEAVTWINRRTGATTAKPIRNVFVMIGAEPNSGWLFGTVQLDRKGFVLTGGANSFDGTPYATNVPGMYAVGDIRATSVKRIASAVGEGSVVISDVHQYLSDHRNEFSALPHSALAALRSAAPLRAAERLSL
jgi:thioredoxin reductase (NADPH)